MRGYVDGKLEGERDCYFRCGLVANAILGPNRSFTNNGRPKICKETMAVVPFKKKDGRLQLESNTNVINKVNKMH
jgi:hypothetical protein